MKEKAYKDPNGTRLTRDLVPYKCTRCRAIGHNSRRCPLPPPIVLEEQNLEPSGAQGANQGASEGASKVVAIKIHKMPLTEFANKGQEHKDMNLTMKV